MEEDRWYCTWHMAWGFVQLKRPRQLTQEVNWFFSPFHFSRRAICHHINEAFLIKFVLNTMCYYYLTPERICFVRLRRWYDQNVKWTWYMELMSILDKNTLSQQLPRTLLHHTISNHEFLSCAKNMILITIMIIC